MEVYFRDVDSTTSFVGHEKSHQFAVCLFGNEIEVNDPWVTLEGVNTKNTVLLARFIGMIIRIYFPIWTIARNFAVSGVVDEDGSPQDTVR